MKRLFVVRHGIAVAREAFDADDDERPLTDKGERRIRRIAKGLKRLGVAPERIVTSPLPRASKTAELIAEALQISKRLETSSLLRPETEPKNLRTWLDTRLEESLMIVGHNPNLNELLGLLLGLDDAILPFELKKGGAAAFDVRGNRHHLDWFATPRLLRTLH